MIVRRKAFADVLTGEKVTFFVVAPEYRDKNFVKINALSLSLLKDEKIAGKAIRLLVYILEHKIEFNNIIFDLTYGEVAKELHIGRSTYFEWLRVLKEEKILLPMGKRSTKYMLNPEIACKGSMKSLRELYGEKLDMLIKATEEETK